METRTEERPDAPRCAFSSLEDGASCTHAFWSHSAIPHPMPGGPLIGICHQCEYTPAYTHYYVAATSPSPEPPE